MENKVRQLDYKGVNSGGLNVLQPVCQLRRF